MPITHAIDPELGPLLEVGIRTPGGPPFKIMAQIDTGASRSVVDLVAAGLLNLRHIGNGIIDGAMIPAQTTPFFRVVISLPDGDGVWVCFSVDAAGLDLSDKGVAKVLVGRDILSGCDLTYRGPKSTFTISPSRPQGTSSRAGSTGG